MHKSASTIVTLVALTTLVSGCSGNAPIITQSKIGKCIASHGYQPFNAGDADVTVAYRNDAESLMIALTVDEGNVIPLEQVDATRIVAVGCDL